MSGWAKLGKRVSEMGFNSGGGIVNWFPGHMAAATRAIRDRLKLADLVIEVRDARVCLSPFSICSLSSLFQIVSFRLLEHWWNMDYVIWGFD